MRKREIKQLHFTSETTLNSTLVVPVSDSASDQLNSILVINYNININIIFILFVFFIIYPRTAKYPVVIELIFLLQHFIHSFIPQSKHIY